MNIKSNTVEEMAIRENFRGLGTKPYALYKNQEAVTRLMDLQEAMENDLSARFPADYIAEDYIDHNISRLIRKYRLSRLEDAVRLEENVKNMGKNIASYKKGLAGERNARKALRCLEYDDSVKVLYNITLACGKDRTEYDAIVIAPYGLFAIEVKNYFKDMHFTEKGIMEQMEGSKYPKDLGERMSCKEFLMKEHLKKFGNIHYTPILLYANNMSHLTDDYRKVQVSYCNTIVSDIRANGGKRVLTDYQIEKIAEQLESENVPCTSKCLIPCDEIIRDYASVVAKIEKKASKGFFRGGFLFAEKPASPACGCTA